jgi:hypothetical protein
VLVADHGLAPSCGAVALTGEERRDEEAPAQAVELWDE